MKNAAEETAFERLRREERELRERLRSRGFRFAASDRLSREALHLLPRSTDRACYLAELEQLCLAEAELDRMQRTKTAP